LTAVRKEEQSLAAAPPSGRVTGLPFGFKVLAGIAVVFAMLAAAIVGAVFSIFSLSRDQAQLQERNVPYATALSTAALNAKGIANDERGYLISGDPEFLREIEERLLNARTAFYVATISADGEAQVRAVDEAREGFERWVRALEEELATFKAGNRAAAQRAALGPGRELRKDYEASLTEAQSVAKIAIQRRRNSLASSGWAIILLASLLVVLAVGLAVTFWLFRTLDDAAKRIAGSEPEPVPLPLLEERANRLRRRKN
jgi:methyl-accepting chemotaxis protein